MFIKCARRFYFFMNMCKVTLMILIKFLCVLIMFETTLNGQRHTAVFLFSGYMFRSIDRPSSGQTQSLKVQYIIRHNIYVFLLRDPKSSKNCEQLKL